ncbi:MAG: hypothetical protein Q8O76_14275, partial [Chloroflexota bacterium]|nr:hypothetical protein [Chloroflexota bacterium]
MNWGDGGVASARRSPDDKECLRQDPLRRKVMSALASMVDKHRRVLEEHDQVVITIHLNWRNGKLREMVMAVPGGRR